MPLAYVALAGFQIISGLQQAEMVRMQAEVQKQIDDFNAEMAEFDAWRAQGYGQTQMAIYQTQLDQAKAAGRVSAAGAGVKLEGSLGELAAEQEIVGLANMLDIENQTRERALGYTRQARSIRLGSQINYGQSQVQARSIIGGSILQAAGTVVAGMGKQPLGKESPSGYEVPNPGSKSLSMNTRGGMLTGTSQDFAKDTGYLGLPF